MHGGVGNQVPHDQVMSAPGKWTCWIRKHSAAQMERIDESKLKRALGVALKFASGYSRLRPAASLH